MQSTSPSVQQDFRGSASIAGGAPGLYRRYGKRALDILIGVPLLLMLLPVIVLLAALVVLTSGWPPFYAAQRVGKGGRSFRMWKLRTMVRDADRALDEWRRTIPDIYRSYEADYKLPGDPRVTPLGRFLRRSSLDELPQVFNVVKGDMSLVGARPVIAAELAGYGELAEELLRLPPGITGRWQVGGRSEIRYPERIWVELEYGRSLSLRRDIAILLRTLAAPIRFNGM